MNNVEAGIGKFYDKHHVKFGYRKRDATSEMKGYFKDFNVTKNTIFVEAGGSGCRALAMAKMGMKSYFIDVSEKNVNERKSQSSNLIGISDSVLTVKLENIDLIFSMGVLHHTLSPKLALLNMSKWLKIGGILYLSYATADSLEAFLNEFMRSILPKTATYENIFVKNVQFEALWHPFLNYGTSEIVMRDMKKLGFEIFKEYIPERIAWIKKRETSVKLEDLEYNPGIKPKLTDEMALMLIRDIIKMYFTRKPSLMAKIKYKFQRL